MTEEKKRPPGRPPLPKGRARSVKLEIRVSPAFKSIADRLALQEDETVSELIRRLVTREAKRKGIE